MATIDLGKIKQVWRGTYNNSTAYVVDDLVEYTDNNITSSYICVANSTGNAPSSSGTAHASWNFVAKGVSDPIPSQSGNAGKFLKTNGSALSFGAAGKNIVVNATQATAQYTSSNDLISVDIVATKTNPYFVVHSMISWNIDHATSQDSKNVRLDMFYKINSGSWQTFSDNAYATDVPALGYDSTHQNNYDVTQRVVSQRGQVSGVSADDTVSFKIRFDAGSMGGATFHFNRSHSTSAEGCSTIMVYEE